MVDFEVETKYCAWVAYC